MTIEEKKPAKRSYERPKLLVYGAVRELTQAKTSGQPDSDSPGGGGGVNQKT
ncbi:MAG: lasso RiPP family leader peptide-containing protein [Nitrosomonas sp.]|jgi:hypothetical protein|nr:lasso RiPP family leader peptide-containing protein [Nitrosomonas sp.]